MVQCEFLKGNVASVRDYEGLDWESLGNSVGLACLWLGPADGQSVDRIEQANQMDNCAIQEGEEHAYGGHWHPFNRGLLAGQL